MTSVPPTVTVIAKNLKSEYNSLAGTDEIRMMQGLQSIIELHYRKLNLKSMLHEVALIMHRLFPFRELSIGIKSPTDGLYRYVELIGFAPAAKSEHLKLSYTYEQMYDQKEYPYITISKYSLFRYAEREPGEEISEKESFSRPSLLSATRKSEDEMLEADYFDIFIFGEKDDLIGWIEVAQPKEGLIPPMRTIRWLELFAIAIAPYLEQELQKMKISEFGKTLSASKD
ncbi:MAG: hypothetical protein QXE18_04980 [Thermoplasmata archaeon]